MQGFKPYLLPLIAAVVLVGLYLIRPSAHDDSREAASSDPAPNATVERAGARGAGDGERPAPAKNPIPEAAVPADKPAADPRPPAAEVSPSEQRARRDAMRTRIAEAIAGPPAAALDGKAPAQPPKLDKDYIRQRIRDDLVPIAQECYESALADKPNTGGKLTMQFSIVGAADVGGIVDEVSLDEDTTLTHPELIECMTESMMSVTFAPPPGGGTVTVTYPFIFEAE